MSFDWSQYSLEQLRSHSTYTFRQGGGTRPDVYLVEIDGHKAVLKDQNGADSAFAKYIGPILNWRECKALERLSSVSSVPNLLLKPDMRSFLMSYHQSEQITRLEHISVEWPLFFEKLEASIAQIHHAGVAHNDLRNPTNTLVTPNGDPILCDLVACFCKGSRFNFINHWMFEKFKQVDRSALTKLKQKVAPELVTQDDVHPDQIAGKTGIKIKQLGQLVRRLSRRLFTTE